MLRIDKAILDTNAVICENISRLGEIDRGLLSQNILSQVRNFVEYVAIKIFANGNDVNPNDYNLNVAALKKGRMMFKDAPSFSNLVNIIGKDDIMRITH